MQDKRRYVRMSTVFPVEFSIVGSDGDQTREHLLQAFTCNVSDGGMCIEFKNFDKDNDRRLDQAGVFLSLTINPPFSRSPIEAQARVVWVKKEESASYTRYVIGVAYELIESKARKRLIAYARRRLWLPRLMAALGLSMLAGLVAITLHTQSLKNENKALGAQLREGAIKRSQAAGELVTLSGDRSRLESELVKVLEDNSRLEKAVQSISMATMQERVDFEEELEESRDRESRVRAQLDKVLDDQIKLRDSYQVLSIDQKEASEKALSWMSSWLMSHRNARTGLVASFEGDPSLENVAFTYDQALTAQVFLLAGEKNHAEAILSFFEERPHGEPFVNAYDTHSGTPQEAIIHTGPNIWVGIAALQYEALAHDKRFVPLAERVANWVMGIQDAEGGVPGGPDITWYSTEHNLDAHAFFGLLAQATGHQKYTDAQSRTRQWLKKYAYSNQSQPVNRGKGDATIATDTLAWSIAAIGPGKLLEMGFDPEGILDFAQQNCAVTVDFTQPDGKTLKVSGFDFAKAKNLGRGGILSTEWTAQMIVSYKVMARYFVLQGQPDKARAYREKADLYRNELQKMFIISPSRTGQGRGCLPYASADNADTGHGWRTPSGDRTGSVAGTAYGFFAWSGYNPFERGGGQTDADL